MRIKTIGTRGSPGRTVRVRRRRSAVETLYVTGLESHTVLWSGCFAQLGA